MKVLDSLYYTFYKWLLKTSLRDIAEYFAFMWIALLFFINAVIIEKKVGFDALEIMPAKVWSALIIVPLMIIFYFTFVANKRYITIAEHFANETKQQKRIRNLIVIGYVVLTFTILLIK